MASNSNVIKEDLKSLSKKFSIRNFITDLPRMLNESFKKLYDAIFDITTGFYDPDTKTLKSDRLDSTFINATTIVAQNLLYRGSDDNVHDYGELESRIDAVEKRLDNITFITKEQIDELYSNIIPTNTVNVDSSIIVDSSLYGTYFTWGSLDSSVASVYPLTSNNRYGVINGGHPGYTTIIASTENGFSTFYVEVLPSA